MPFKYICSGITQVVEWPTRNSLHTQNIIFSADIYISVIIGVLAFNRYITYLPTLR